MVDFVTARNIAQTDFISGAMLLVDKPEGWTSFDVVNKIRGTLRHVYQVKKIKVGHAGTLDPIATGLLIICTGKYTPKLNTLQGLGKEYTGEMILGAVTASYDRETPPEESKSFAHLSHADLLSAAQSFVGSIEQLPPMYSAIKKDGKPLYRLARAGKEVEREAREVRIDTFEVTSIDLPTIHFRVVCSKGTYIRSLAHDFGQRLGCGAYLKELRRTQIGDYRVEDAWGLEDLVAAIGDKMPG